ncbi:MAG: helix-turn-helix domain-containing protein [Myxacorys chilensis ATA2-1-KO14]|nr:helix-turn-helix domain-containing protein [Myxacorys chilensis ATA2-1-KO14]
MHQYFDKTLKQFGITGKKLSEVTGISTTHISEFRNGKTNPSCEMLERMLDGADQIKLGAKRHFCELLAGKEPQPIEDPIERLDDIQLAQLLLRVANRLENRKSVPQELLSA